MFNKLSVYLVVLFFLFGCVEDTSKSEGSQTGNVPKELVGEWVYPDTGKSVYITTQTELEYEKIDNNLLRVSDTRYLVRSSTSATEVVASVNTVSGGSAPAYIARYGGVGGANAIFKNIKDETVSQKVTTDSNGLIQQQTDLPAGEYELTIESESGEKVTQEITLVDNTEELGTYHIVESGQPNFKSEVVWDSNVDFIYGDEQEYSGVIRVRNIGDSLATGLNYVVTYNDSRIKSFLAENKQGSIVSGGYFDIPFTISFNQLQLNENKVRLNILMKDVSNKEWSDQVTIKVYRDKQIVFVKTKDANLRGFVRLPNNKLKTLNISSGYIELPLLMDNQYNIVISNTNLGGETAYSLGYQVQPDKLDQFTDTGRYESTNGTYDGAELIPLGQAISAYVHLGDIDFYQIKTEDDNAKLFNTLFWVSPDTEHFSNEITITEEMMAYGQTASVSNGKIYVDGSDYGTQIALSEGQKVKLWLKAPAQFDKTYSAIFKLGELQATFSLNPKGDALNDTGVTQSVSSTGALSIDCTGDLTPELQDCNYGRDKSGEGFDLVKLNADGTVYSGSSNYSVEPWSCVKDQNTGFIWEVKSNLPESIHFSDTLFGRGETVSTKYGTAVGTWDELINQLNKESFCGKTNWRLPSVSDLQSVIDYNSINLMPDEISLNLENEGCLFTSDTSPTLYSGGYFIKGFFISIATKSVAKPILISSKKYCKVVLVSK